MRAQLEPLFSLQCSDDRGSTAQVKNRDTEKVVSCSNEFGKQRRGGKGIQVEGGTIKERRGGGGGAPGQQTGKVLSKKGRL